MPPAYPYPVALSPYGEPSIVVNQATGTGTTNSSTFSLQKPAEGGGNNVTFQATGTFSVLAANLMISLDGGNDWAIAETGLNFETTPVITVTNLAETVIYQLNIQSFTGTSATIYASAA